MLSKTSLNAVCFALLILLFCCCAPKKMLSTPPKAKYDLTMGAIMDTVLCVLEVQAEDSSTYVLHNLDNHAQQNIKSDDRIWLGVGAYRVISAQNDTINFDLDKSGGVYSLHLYHGF
jgi:hypothetical protein